MTASPKFQRTREDFTCLHCGTFVRGSGYTNHCPHCLYSKHVDVNPGDRLSSCGGTMVPVRVEGVSGAYRITHHCDRCGFERLNKVSPEDSFDALLRLAAQHAA